MKHIHIPGDPIRIGNRWVFPNGKTLPVVSGGDGTATEVRSPELVEIEGKLRDRQKKLDLIFSEAGPDLDMSKVKSVDGDSAAKTREILKLNDECAALSKDRDEKRDLLKVAQERLAGRGDELEPGDEEGLKHGWVPSQRMKSIGDVFGDAGLLKKNAKGTVDFDMLKAVFSTTAGWAPEATRGPRLVELPQTPFLNVLQIVPSTRTTQSAIKYMEETVVTNTAAETAEGGTKPEAALEVEEKLAPVRKIAVWIHVTDEVFEDEPRARAYVNNRLPRMVRQRLANQVIAGSGVGVNLLGIANVVGVQSQAKAADPGPDAIHKAMTKVIVNGDAFPDTIAMNPLDWEDIRLLRTLDGIYIWGNPSEAGPARIWGLNVTLIQQLAEGTAVVGDFGNYSELAIRKDIEVTSGWINDDLIKNQQVLLAEMRAATVWYRPSAFCLVTGL